MPSSKSLPAFQHRRVVEFHETDAAGLAHFSRLLLWMEAAEHAYLRALRMPVFEKNCGWPRVAARAQWLAPLRFDDEIETRLWVRAVGVSSVTYRFEVWRLSGRRAPERAARGQWTVIHATLDRRTGRPRPRAIPALLRQKLLGV